MFGASYDMQVILALQKSCAELTEEDLSKVAVNLLNCQSAVENRAVFPCTSDMVRTCFLIGYVHQIVCIFLISTHIKKTLLKKIEPRYKDELMSKWRMFISLHFNNISALYIPQLIFPE